MYKHKEGLKLALKMLRRWINWKKIYSKYGNWNEMYFGIMQHLEKCPASVSVEIAKEICNKLGSKARRDYLFGGILELINVKLRKEVKAHFNNVCEELVSKAFNEMMLSEDISDRESLLNKIETLMREAYNHADAVVFAGIWQRTLRRYWVSKKPIRLAL